MNVITKWIDHASVFDWITNITAILATIALALLAFGFRRYVKRPRNAPIDYIGTGIWVLAFLQVVRMLYWDIVPDIMGFDWRDDYHITSGKVNWIFNSLIIVGAWFKLKGYWIIVEDKAPGEYNVFTAVFYPKRLRLWLESKNEVEEKDNGS